MSHLNLHLTYTLRVYHDELRKICLALSGKLPEKEIAEARELGIRLLRQRSH